MIKESDLNAAIAECQGKRNPDAKTCMMLAAFYTIRREMFGEEKDAEPSYSFAPAPVAVFETDRDSAFAKAIDGKAQDAIMPVLDELMQTLSVIYPKLYDAVMDKLNII